MVKDGGRANRWLAKGLPPTVTFLGRQIMDGSPGLLAPALLVVRGFAGTRLESQVLASAYDRLLPAGRYSPHIARDTDAAPATVSWPRLEIADADLLSFSRKGA